jgi:hypothetical protein
VKSSLEEEHEDSQPCFVTRATQFFPCADMDYSDTWRTVSSAHSLTAMDDISSVATTIT